MRKWLVMRRNNNVEPPSSSELPRYPWVLIGLSQYTTVVKELQTHLHCDYNVEQNLLYPKPKDSSLGLH